MSVGYRAAARGGAMSDHASSFATSDDAAAFSAVRERDGENSAG